MILFDSIKTFGSYLMLMKRVLVRPERFKMFLRRTLHEIYQLGIDSIPIVLIISLFIGAVLCIQMKTNVESPWMPKFVTGYATREVLLLEFSSTIMCLILAGKVGSNITSEIGANHVIAVDSGSGQMAMSLRADDRVTVIENFNARYMKPEDFEYSPTVVVMDVSFISATCIIPAIFEVSADGADFICLVKPQFEVGRAGVGKGGIVKDERLRKSALDKVVDFAKAIGFEHKASCVSPIKGGDGNIEHLVHFIVRKE